MNILLSFLKFSESPEAKYFFVFIPQFLSRGRRRNDLLNPAFRGTIQTFSDRKNAPRPSRKTVLGAAAENLRRDIDMVSE